MTQLRQHADPSRLFFIPGTFVFFVINHTVIFFIRVPGTCDTCENYARRASSTRVMGRAGANFVGQWVLLYMQPPRLGREFNSRRPRICFFCYARWRHYEWLHRTTVCSWIPVYSASRGCSPPEINAEANPALAE